MSHKNIWKNVENESEYLNESTAARLLDTIYDDNDVFLYKEALTRITKSNEYYEYIGLGDAGQEITQRS